MTDNNQPPANLPVLARRGLLLVLSSPSGAGKTTIARAVLEQDRHVTMSVSATTRPPRPGEVDGRDYHFVGIDTFNKMVAEADFLEHARVYDNFYGTPKALVEHELGRGRDVLFDIDWQGTQQIGENARDDLVSVFILPPSVAELERRLTTRASDSPEVVATRMSKAGAEISHWYEYQYIVVNTNLAHSVQAVLSILRAERLKRERQRAVSDFITSLRGD